MMPHKLPAGRVWIPLLLAGLLTACASTSRVSPDSAPPLAPIARQEPPPGICLPTCSAGWRRLVESLLQKPTGLEPPELPASAPMTH